MRTRLTAFPHAPRVSAAARMHASAINAASESLANALGDTLSLPTPVLAGNVRAAARMAKAVNNGSAVSASVAKTG